MFSSAGGDEVTDHLHMSKFDDITELLLSAGYFRARYAELKMFDKVIGGLCWCIAASGISVDVDILFEDNMALGRKV